MSQLVSVGDYYRKLVLLLWRITLKRHITSLLEDKTTHLTSENFYQIEFQLLRSSFYDKGKVRTTHEPLPSTLTWAGARLIGKLIMSHQIYPPTHKKTPLFR